MIGTHSGFYYVIKMAPFAAALEPSQILCTIITVSTRSDEVKFFLQFLGIFLYFDIVHIMFYCWCWSIPNA